MANLSNSSISALLDYDGTLPPIIEPCSLPDANGNQIDVNCTQICNDSVAIFDTDNLLICGLWVMVSSNNPYTSPNGSQLNASDPLSVSSAFAPFQNVGFDTSSLEATATYGELISAILLRIYVAVRRSTTSDDGTIPWSCTTVSLFDLGGQEGVSSGFSGCLDAICSPRTLNPDLAGIGVFTSFILQSSIAIIAFIVLLAFEIRPLVKTTTAKVHTEAVIAALVDFHKAQCYFSSTIQITAMVLYKRRKVFHSWDSNQERSSFDTSALVILATCGFLPIVLTLACIARYGRQSWYLITLSTITFILAGGALIIAYFALPSTLKLLDGSIDGTLSDIGAIISTNILYSLCGSSSLGRNQVDYGTIHNPWVWIAWLNSTIWLLICIFKKAATFKRLRLHRERFIAVFKNYPGIRTLQKSRAVYRVGTFIFIVTWSLCFAGQYYLFSIYFRAHVISPTWSFGQIIAITVWVPSIVEFLYIEYNGIGAASKYRYPSPLKVMREVVQQTDSLVTLNPREPTRDGEASSQFREDISPLIHSETA